MQKGCRIKILCFTLPNIKTIIMENIQMPFEDKRLIAQAMEIKDPTKWDIVSNLEDQAISSEAKKILKRLRVRLYRQEEYQSNMY